jgi:hypothetical protein
MLEELGKSNNITFSIDADDSFLTENKIVDELPLEAVDKKIEEFVFEEKTTPLAPKLEKEVQAIGLINGAIGITKLVQKDKKQEIVKKEKKEKTVAIHSTRNVTWNGVGKVYRGYNIVDEETAEKWLTREHIRIATPAEVAAEYGL